MYRRQKGLQSNNSSQPSIKKVECIRGFDSPESVFEEQIIKHKNEIAHDAAQGAWEKLHGKLFFPLSFLDSDSPMSTNFLMVILVSIQLSTVWVSVINDCDEVYNYWEPLHLLLFGRGLQTWEYSPEYAIRSWLYIVIHYIPAYIMSIIISAESKVILFFCLRTTLGMFYAGAQYMLCSAIAARLGYGVARFYFLMNVLAVGSFYSSCAFLPSAFSMIINMFSMAFWLREKWTLAILCTSVSALVGWPFAAVLGLPIVVEMLVIRRGEYAWKFVKVAVAFGVIVLGALYAVDSHYYGKTVIAPLNIVMYNVFSKHGPELYGVEPFTYYIKNLILNWNIAPVLVILAVPLSLLAYFPTCVEYNFRDKNAISEIVSPTKSILYWYRYIPVVLIALTAFTWSLIFFAQPHKEERFLFPIYPHIAVLSAITLASIQQLFPQKLHFLPYLIVAGFAVLSFSRGFAVYKNYQGVVDTYTNFNSYLISPPYNVHFSEMNDPIQVCVGKEWYRQPSSFFIPEIATDAHGTTKKVELHFIRSGFRGLLPKPYPTGPLPNITRLIPTEMNELNLEEQSRYIPVESCDFLIDFDDQSGGNIDEPNYIEMTDKFKVIYKTSVIIPEKSHWLYRAFWIPFVSEKHKTFGTYAALQKIH